MTKWCFAHSHTHTPTKHMCAHTTNCPPHSHSLTSVPAPSHPHRNLDRVWMPISTQTLCSTPDCFRTEFTHWYGHYGTTELRGNSRKGPLNNHKGKQDFFLLFVFIIFLFFKILFFNINKAETFSKKSAALLQSRSLWC